MGGLAGLLGGPLPYERYANLQACPPSIGVDASRSTKSAYGDFYVCTYDFLF